MKVGSNFAFGRLNNVTQTYQESATKEGIGLKTLILHLFSLMLLCELIICQFILTLSQG